MKPKHHIRSDSSLSLFDYKSDVPPDATAQFSSLLKSKYVEAQGHRHKVVIEFDGGTPCNIPRLGYGDGYGSYQIDSGGTRAPIVRRNFGVPMSANVAEISTLIAAIKTVLKSFDPKITALDIRGDSKTALWRCAKRTKPTSPPSDFKAAADELFSLCAQFNEVKTNWRGRKVSVRLFGH